ncbi:MAG: TonB-dependent receptor [Wenzhouxiangella sp.]
MFKVRSIVVMLLLSALLTGHAMAQDTAASLRGSVVTEAGDPIAGASLTILHVPSGTVTRATSSATGSFFQSGLRVGGPFQVTITRDGFEPSIIEGISLAPGVQDPIQFLMLRTGQVTDRILVMGTRGVDVSELAGGVGSVFNADDIRNQPGGDRDVIRTLLRDPLAQSDGVGNLSVAGVNPRFNGLTIDGSRQQDNFGLGANTYAGSRSPINIDAVESVTLAIADYSVTAANFTGAGVNIVTRSGTNDFRGNAYFAYRDDGWVGSRFGDRRFDIGEFTEKEYGFTIGGPIVRDRLFFFISYDEYDAADSFDNSQGDATAGRDPRFFTELASLIQNIYGFDPIAPPRTGNTPETSERLLARFDWNINDQHRAAFTYQSTSETQVQGRTAGNFASAWYDVPFDLTSYSLQLFSDWTPSLSTTLRANYTEVDRGQNCRAGAGVGHFQLNFNANDLIGTPLEGLLTSPGNFGTVAGCDRFRHANTFEDDRFQLFASADYAIGDHVITFGVDHERYNLENVFMQRSAGEWVFNNAQQLINRQAQQFFYRNATTNNAVDGSASWGYDRTALFLGTRWQATTDLQLNMGLRYERVSTNDTPRFSQEVFDTFGQRTDVSVDGLDLLMPRVGFLFTGWDRTTLSGGIGLFAGGSPEVWVSNSFNEFAEVQLNNLTGNDVDIFNVPPQALQAVANSVAVFEDVIDPGFEQPSDWKSSLRFERSFDFGPLGDDYRFSAQYLYVRTNKGFLWRNLGQLVVNEALPTGVAPDGRPIYADLQALGLTNLIQLTNGGGGSSHAFTLALAKTFDFGLDFQVSYAHQNSRFTAEGTSSRGISAWRGQFDADRNNPSARPSLFNIAHTFRVGLGYENRFIGDLMSRVDVFGSITTGRPWSSAFNTAPNNALFGRAGQGENPFQNNPLYIPDPAGDPRVVFASSFQQEAFFDFVNRNGLPTGEIHQPFSNRSRRWNNIWDLRFQQELPGIPGLDRFSDRNRFSMIVDIDNFLNLINKDWGVFTFGPGNGQADIVQADLVRRSDVAANGVDGATALLGDAARTACTNEEACVYRFRNFLDRSTAFPNGSRSVYQIRLTLRYDF